MINSNNSNNGLAEFTCDLFAEACSYSMNKYISDTKDISFFSDSKMVEQYDLIPLKLILNRLFLENKINKTEYDNFIKSLTE